MQAQDKKNILKRTIMKIILLKEKNENVHFYYLLLIIAFKKIQNAKY